MGTEQRNLQLSQATDTEFRDWVAGLIAGLIAAGITQTSDTGQIDTGTVAKPASTNVQQGYAVFRFNDTEHATNPIFFRIGFGSGSATTTPAMWITFGTGSDGAGNITGIWRPELQRNSSVSTSQQMCLTSYDSTTGIVWANWASSGSQGLMFIIARTCDLTTETPDGQGVIYNWTSSTIDLEYAPWATMTVANHYPAGQPGGYGNSITDENGVPVVFKYLGWGIVSADPALWTIPGILIGDAYQFAYGAVVSATPGPTAHTYRAMTDLNRVQGSWSQAGIAQERPLMIWE